MPQDDRRPGRASTGGPRLGGCSERMTQVTNQPHIPCLKKYTSSERSRKGQETAETTHGEMTRSAQTRVSSSPRPTGGAQPRTGAGSYHVAQDANMRQDPGQGPEPPRQSPHRRSLCSASQSLSPSSSTRKGGCPSGTTHGGDREPDRVGGVCVQASESPGRLPGQVSYMWSCWDRTPGFPVKDRHPLTPRAARRGPPPAPPMPRAVLVSTLGQTPESPRTPAPYGLSWKLQESWLLLLPLPGPRGPSHHQPRSPGVSAGAQAVSTHSLPRPDMPSDSRRAGGVPRAAGKEVFPPHSAGEGNVVTSISQGGKLRPREGKPLAPGCPGRASLKLTGSAEADLTAPLCALKLGLETVTTPPDLLLKSNIHANGDGKPLPQRATPALGHERRPQPGCRGDAPSSGMRANRRHRAPPSAASTALPKPGSSSTPGRSGPRPPQHTWPGLECVAFSAMTHGHK